MTARTAFLSPPRRRSAAAAVLTLALALAAGSPPAFAHKLHVFATTDGNEITGSAYFTGGSRAMGVPVRARAPDGRLLAETVTDAAGRFTLPVTAKTRQVIVVDTGDGHVARQAMTAEELSLSGAPAAPAVAAAGEGQASGAPARAVPADEAAVARAVARAVAPLREQIAAFEARVRLHDILGGLGYLAGLAGLGFWLMARREARRGGGDER